MADTGVSGDRAETASRHRVTEIEDELAGNFTERVTGPNARPRCVSELHWQRTHRSTHAFSVEGTTTAEGLSHARNPRRRPDARSPSSRAERQVSPDDEGFTR